MLKTLVYAFIVDPGHGWLQVPIHDVETAGIQVSPYSPKVKGWWFLEEDCDAPAYLEACKALGYEVRWNEVEVKSLGHYQAKVGQFNRIMFK